MKKTIKINISGSIFFLDEDAYEKLKKYLDQISKHFKNQEGGDEIIKDIELRIAELFQLKLSGSKEVISIEDVEEVINKLGDPADFTDDEDMENQESKKEYTRRLYRDPDNAVLGGVAAGLGAYLKIDAVWIRLIFILLLLGYGIIGVIYLILWLAIPKAETYEQKMEMRGEDFTISEIEKRVKQEYSEVKDNINKFKKSDEYKNFTHRLNEILQTFGRILLGLVKIVAVIIGIGLIVAGVTISLSFFGVTLFDFPVDHFPQFDLDDFPVALFLGSVFNPVAIITFISTVTILALIPVLLLIYLVFRILGFRGSDRVVFSSAIILWTVALILTIGVSFWQVKGFAYNATSPKTESIQVKNTDQPIMLSMSENKMPEYYIEELYFDQDDHIYGIDKKGKIYMYPEIDIEKSSSERFSILIKQMSRGHSHQNAAANADHIDYNWQIDSNHIKLASFFVIPKETQFRMQQVKIVVRVPEGRKIYLDENVQEYLEHIRNDHDLWKDELGNKTWIMGDDELILHEQKSVPASIEST
jgi:phage shock protein PspC (stress-responsive transcriptional regulator)